MSFTGKTPPPYNAQSDDYAKWKKRFKVWQGCTEVQKAKQGGLLVLRLDDNTQDAVLESVSYEDIKTEGGVDKVITKLDEMFKKDPTFTAFQVYEEFERYRRPANVSIIQYLTEFEKRLSKVKANGTTMSDDVLVYRLLKSANLKESEEQLVKMTIVEMKYDKMVEQLKKAFVGISVSSNTAEASGDSIHIKEEQEEELENDTLYNNWRRNKQSMSGRREDIYRDRREPQQSFGGKYLPSDKQQFFGGKSLPKKRRGKNPLDRYGNVTRCRLCDSINHWEEFCPDNDDKEQKTFHCQEYEDGTYCDSDKGSLLYEIENQWRKNCPDRSF